MATITTYCSLNNLSPPPTGSGSTPITRAAEFASLPKERSWRNKCLLGLTCAVIGLEMGNFGVVGDQEFSAVAMDMQSAGAAAAGTKIIRAQRWSDRRTCPPWKLNSLETIVPENLPRPSAQRRWEATGFFGAAPLVKVVEQSVVAKGCFNL